MKALVINLQTASQRMSFQSQQLKQLGIDFQRVNAFSINDIDEPFYQQYAYTWERPLRRSEVACFLSHQRAWEMVIQHNKPYLILEDDALLSSQVPLLLNQLNTPDTIDLITLEVRSRKKIVAKQAKLSIGDIQLFSLYQDRTGAAGYILWPTGAKQLMQRFKQGKIALADAFISSTYSLNAYQAEPALIIQLDQCNAYQIYAPIDTQSAISNSHKPKAKQVHWVFRLKRIKAQVRLAARQIAHFIHAKKRMIKLDVDGF